MKGKNKINVAERPPPLPFWRHKTSGCFCSVTQPSFMKLANVYRCFPLTQRVKIKADTTVYSNPATEFCGVVYRLSQHSGAVL